MSKYPFVPLTTYREYPQDEMIARSKEFYSELRRRRTIREFSDRAVPREVIEQCLLAAGTAPNGANRQPWHFVVVEDTGVKTQIREAAEREEKIFYNERAPKDWLEALAPLGTDEHKPYLVKAPYLIAIFAQNYELSTNGDQIKNYYVTESVGIATGMLITALHSSGLATLTHTPSPMGFLNEVLGRPNNERPFLLLVVGYPDEGVQVPDINKKPLEEIATFR